MTTGPESTRIFYSRQNIGWQAAGFLVGGAIFLALLILRFVFLVLRPAQPGDDMMPGVIGGVSVVGIGLIARGVFLLRTTTRVAIDPSGVYLETFFGRREILWTDIDRVERDKQSPWLGGNSYAVVRLIGRTGKPLATISETIDEFEIFANEVITRSSTTARHATYDSAADEQRRVNHDIKRLRWAAVMLGLLTLGMAAALVAGINEEKHLRLYATEGVQVDAKIVRREMVRVTPHLEYAFEVDGQTYSRDATMWQGPAYDALEGRETVPVEYLRSNPSWNRLVSGEEPGPQFSGKFFFVSIGGLIMFGSFFIISLLGFDLKTDKGVTRLTRHGRTIKKWGTGS